VAVGTRDVLVEAEGCCEVSDAGLAGTGGAPELELAVLSTAVAEDATDEAGAVGAGIGDGEPTLALFGTTPARSQGFGGDGMGDEGWWSGLGSLLPVSPLRIAGQTAVIIRINPTMAFLGSFGCFSYANGRLA